ncbi:LOW QUALITY PROTEIN: uncharacterized protein EMH_0006260 [Eimeria mitis]|uniref:Uncharacterized protein n=1 Tax=Eimeria mitis TaxID=44415 RepID=U6K268_9EIME|nr:LOW QUALITY PROTEIN: uncharacterized protein EMH_0006260 [Eimeria mitis]CDJ30387.1 hypothetical protein, conserved [Eimeria mitis]
MLLRWGFVLYALLGCLLFNLVYSSAVEEAVAEPQVALDESKVFVQPSQDVVLLSPHYGLEVPGTKGVMRVILGLCLMLGKGSRICREES